MYTNLKEYKTNIDKKTALRELHRYFTIMVQMFFDEKRAFTSQQVLEVVKALVFNKKILTPDQDISRYVTFTLIPMIIKANQQYFGQARWGNIVPSYRSYNDYELETILDNLYAFLRFLLKTSPDDPQSADNFYKNTRLKEVLIDFNHARFGGSFNIEDRRLIISIPTHLKVPAEEIKALIDKSFREGFTILDHENLSQAIDNIIDQLIPRHDYSLKLATDRASTAREIFRRVYKGTKDDNTAIRDRIENYVRELWTNGSGAEVFYYNLKDRTGF